MRGQEQRSEDDGVGFEDGDDLQCERHVSWADGGAERH